MEVRQNGNDLKPRVNCVKLIVVLERKLSQLINISVMIEYLVFVIFGVKSIYDILHVNI